MVTAYSPILRRLSYYSIAVELNRISLPPSYYCLGLRLGLRRSLLPLSYVCIEALEPHLIRQFSFLIVRLTVMSPGRLLHHL